MKNQNGIQGVKRVKDSDALRECFIGRDIDFHLLGWVAASQGGNHPPNRSPDGGLNKGGKGDFLAVHPQTYRIRFPAFEDFFFEKVHQPFGVIEIEAGDPPFHGMVRGDGQQVIFFGAKKLSGHFLARDFDLGLIIFFETLGENEVHVLDISIPELGQTGIMVGIADQGQLGRG